MTSANPVSALAEPVALASIADKIRAPDAKDLIDPS
jgi:hypothetical protein